MMVIAIMGFFYIVGLCYLAKVSGHALNTTVFLLLLFVLPVATALVYRLLLSAGALGVAIVALYFVCATAGLLTLAMLPTISHLQTSIPIADFWRRLSHIVMLLVIAAHFIGAVVAFIFYVPRPHATPVPAVILRFDARHQSVWLFAAFFLFVAFAFQVQPNGGGLNFVVDSLKTAAFNGSFSLWLFVSVAIVGMAWLFASLRTMVSALTAAFGSSVIAAFLYFEFSLRVDTFHYLTNVGPALHLAHGGKLMVDTFSQYGPGPVAATWGLRSLSAACRSVLQIF